MTKESRSSNNEQPLNSDLCESDFRLYHCFTIRHWSFSPIMAIQREKDPRFGYARDFVDVVKSLVPDAQGKTLGQAILEIESLA